VQGEEDELKDGPSELKFQFHPSRAVTPWVSYFVSLSIHFQIFKIGTLTVIASCRALRMK
jgi:hypothetical protein